MIKPEPGSRVLTDTGYGTIQKVHAGEYDIVLDQAFSGVVSIVRRHNEVVVLTDHALLRVVNVDGHRRAISNVVFDTAEAIGEAFQGTVCPQDEVRYWFNFPGHHFKASEEGTPDASNPFLHVGGWVTSWGNVYPHQHLADGEPGVLYHGESQLDPNMPADDVFAWRRYVQGRYANTTRGIMLHVVVNREQRQILYSAFLTRVGWHDRELVFQP